jgi:hypothetical protein
MLQRFASPGTLVRQAGPLGPLGPLHPLHPLRPFVPAGPGGSAGPGGQSSPSGPSGPSGARAPGRGNPAGHALPALTGAWCADAAAWRADAGPDEADPLTQMALADAADASLMRLVLCAASATLALALASSLL